MKFIQEVGGQIFNVKIFIEMLIEMMIGRGAGKEKGIIYRTETTI